MDMHLVNHVLDAQGDLKGRESIIHRAPVQQASVKAEGSRKVFLGLSDEDEKITI